MSEEKSFNQIIGEFSEANALCFSATAHDKVLSAMQAYALGIFLREPKQGDEAYKLAAARVFIDAATIRERIQDQVEIDAPKPG